MNKKYPPAGWTIVVDKRGLLNAIRKGTNVNLTFLATTDRKHILQAIKRAEKDHELA